MDRGRCTDADVALMHLNFVARKKAQRAHWIATRAERAAKEESDAIAEAARQKAKYERQKARELREQD